MKEMNDHTEVDDEQIVDDYRTDVEVSQDKLISRLVIKLTKRVVYKDDGFQEWESLLLHQRAIEGAVRVLGLSLEVDEADGFAYLKNRDEDEDDSLKLISRRQLLFNDSMMLALLRKELSDFENSGSEEETRLFVSAEKIRELMRVHLRERNNEVKMDAKVETSIRNLVEYGFITKAKESNDLYYVRPVIKSFVNADLLQGLMERYAAFVDEKRTAEGAGSDQKNVVNKMDDNDE